MPNQLYPVLFMLSSTFSLSLTGLFSKYLTQYLDGTLLSLLRFLTPALILFAVLSLKKMRFPQRSLLKPLWVRALCIGLCQVCFIYALQHLSLVESVVLFSTGPLFIPLLEKLIFSVRVTRLNIVGLGLTFLGVILLAGDISGFEFRPELLVGLCAGMLNAGSQLSLYRASKMDLNAFEINFWTFVFATLIIVPIVMFNLVSGPQVMVSSDVRIEWLIGAVALLAMFIINTQVFRAKAYKLAQSNSQLAPLIFTNLIFTAIWQLCFFDQTYHAFQWLGLGLIIGANMMCALAPKLVSQWRKKSKLALADSH